MSASSGFRPVSVLTIDVDEELPDAVPGGPALVLVRRSRRPVALLELDLDGEAGARSRLADAIEPFAGGPPGAAPQSGPPPPATVVVATKDRTVSLARCLDRLERSEHPDLEVVVVDNAPSDRSSERLAVRLGRRWSGLRYVCEPVAGASLARNRGVEEADHDVVLFVDDDVEVDQRWAATLSRSFEEDPSVRCATGLVVPAELATPAQAWFEQFGGFGKGVVRRKFDLGPFRPADALYPFAAGVFGSGNNSAVWRPTFESIGGFDPCLGPGTPTRSGEDLDLFLRFIQDGWRILYEPDAIVWHHHRRDLEQLDRQVHDYGVGLAALYLKWALRGTPHLTDLALVAPKAMRAVLSSGSNKNAGKATDYPRWLSRRELRGMLRGPGAYLRARRAAGS